MSTFRLNITSQVRSVALAVVAIPALFVAIAALQARMDALSGSLTQEKDELLLRSGPLLKELSLGYSPLLADIYWTRAVQYYGTRLQERNGTFGSLEPLLDIATTLDPKLVVAYRFGAVFLSEHPPGGAGRPDLAVELVQKGIANNPDQWTLYNDLGFLYYARLKDYQKASEAYLDGSRNTSAPIWMKIMAARVAENGESLETSRLIWAELYNSTKDESVRNRVLLHVQALDAEMVLQKLNGVSEEYWKKFGRFPTSMEKMRDAGLVKGDLKDPAGYPYVMGPNGVPQMDPHSPLQIESNQQKP
jgi:tetratricopeptide (TPR) repeat protein